jgi:hypothetical protein
MNANAKLDVVIMSVRLTQSAQQPPLYPPQSVGPVSYRYAQSRLPAASGKQRSPMRVVVKAHVVHTAARLPFQQQFLQLHVLRNVRI